MDAFTQFASFLVNPWQADSRGYDFFRGRPARAVPKLRSRPIEEGPDNSSGDAISSANGSSVHGGAVHLAKTTDWVKQKYRRPSYLLIRCYRGHLVTTVCCLESCAGAFPLHSFAVVLHLFLLSVWSTKLATNPMWYRH
jgi:hypothetical protein